MFIRFTADLMRGLRQGYQSIQNSDTKKRLKHNVKKQTRYTSVWIGVLVVAITLIIISCSGGRARPRSEARILEVAAAVETEPVNTGGDSADDATVWVNPSDPSQSLVIGTNKKRGLVVYDLAGKEIQSLADGDMK